MDGSLPYLAVGFGLTWIVMGIYAWRLEARIGRVRDRLERHGTSPSRVETPAGTDGEPHEGPEGAR